MSVELRVVAFGAFLICVSLVFLAMDELQAYVVPIIDRAWHWLRRRR